MFPLNFTYKYPLLDRIKNSKSCNISTSGAAGAEVEEEGSRRWSGDPAYPHTVSYDTYYSLLLPHTTKLYNHCTFSFS